MLPYELKPLEDHMKKLAMSSVLLAGTAWLLLANPMNVTGTWTGAMTGDSGSSVHIQFQLKQTGEQVTGTAGPTVEASSSIYDAAIQDDHFRFSVGRDPNPIWKFDLTVSDKEMHGKGDGTRSGQSLGTTNVAMSLRNSQ